MCFMASASMFLWSPGRGKGGVMHRENSGAWLLAVWLLVVGLGFSEPCDGADLYRWVDEQGVVHFSDQPPPASSVRSGESLRILSIPQAPPVPSRERPGTEEKKTTTYVVPFQRSAGGMLVNVLINDRVPAVMIVDTGATMVKLNVKLLRKLDQPLPASPRRQKALTAAGVVDAQEVHVEKIDLNGAVKRGVQASFTDEAHDSPYYDGLLGLSFLSDFRMTVDYENSVMYLER